MRRRDFLAAAGAAVPALLATRWAQAEAGGFPEKDITFIVPYGAGGGFDLVVQVGEAQAQAFAKQPPDGALAGAHRSDQGEVGGGIHPHDLNNPSPRLAVPGNRRPREGNAMSVAKIIELNASSKTSMEDAVKTGLKKASETVKNIKGAWVNEIKVVTDDNGNVQEWRVNLRITFVVS